MLLESVPVLPVTQDGEAEGYRAPMRTNYMERLIESPQVATPRSSKGSKGAGLGLGCFLGFSANGTKKQFANWNMAHRNRWFTWFTFKKMVI
jgi:hypothetical protein